MMMAKTGERSSVTMDELFSMDDGCDDVLIDLDCFWNILETPSDTEEGGLEVLPSDGALQGSQNSKEALSHRAGFPEVGAQSPSYNSEASDYRPGCSDDVSEPAGNPVVSNSERLEQSSQRSSVENVCSRSITNCTPVQGNGLSDTYSNGGTFSFHGANHMTHKEESSDFCQPDHEEDLFGHSGVGVHSEILYHNNLMKQSNLGTSVGQMEDFSIIDRDRSSYASHTDSSSCEITGTDVPDILSEVGDMYFLSPGHPSYFASPKQDFLYSSGFQSLANDDGRLVNVVDEGENRTEDFTCLMPYKDCVGSEVANCGSGSSVSLNRGARLTNFNEMDVMESELAQHSPNTFSNVQRKVQDHIKFEKNNGSVTSIDIVSEASEVFFGMLTGKYYGGGDELLATEGIKRISSNSLPSISRMNYVSGAKDEKEDRLLESKRTLLTLGSVGETPMKNSAAVAHDWHRVLQVSEQPGILPFPSVKAEANCLKLENNVPKFSGSYLSNTTYERVQNSSFEQSNVDDDFDVCILEDMSAPARQHPDSMDGKMVVASEFATSRGPHNQIATGHLRLKSNDERAIFRVVLQDLLQPKSEATPPDGVLAVPLLKHQRIALSWMVNKETKSACCSGGILADDQGLGKTISTIALILKERSSSSKVPKINREQSEAETLNLDDDDDDVVSEEGAEFPQVNGCPINGGTTRPQGKARPAAGTLIVCPTSVLRQWSDELHNKVTNEAGLSVLVYHGSNRTKDPFELAKYDVVVTTYAIVSMEVPKQPVVNENDDLIGTTFKGVSTSKKRKLLGTMPDEKPSRGKKSKKGIDNELFETISGPLAKVGWFRIVLDEAQSIKNHRTQVARACWGLRAKRRWCLSGTPIQNAIDDLYSYFRFLRHEPYAVFRTFCEQLKTPIHKNPKDGYKKLQAVLRTIMLRRTKGTFIDGEPIINLPPKTIEMKKVDFSKEERDFYCRLEAESRAQFAEYAAAGTVKQNYVNILLMLLRLRQACDHPILVKGFCSNSKMTSSIEMAKKLSREKQIFLLNCLEASLAICGICSDPPEDAVVTICGHVYCNQCICQHVIGDDTQCPTKNCKTHLSLSCVFSITTLRTSLSDQLSVENIHNCSDSALAEIDEPCSLSRPQDSSKIKAALELLLSLSNPHNSALRMSSSESLEGGYGREKLHVCDSGEDNGTSDMDRNSNNSVTVVGEKAIVFSQWTRMLDLLEACLKNSSIQYRRLDGTMPVVARDRAVKDFNTLPQVSVMIMSLKAASLGLNMVAACHVLLLDLWWNPTTEDQAIDRAHRIGQTRPVSVFRLTVKDTVEDRILALQQRKREMVASAFGEDETGSRETRLTVEDLKYLFRVD